MRNDLVRLMVWFLCCCVIGGTAGWTIATIQAHAKRAEASECAVTSSGTDNEVARCYTTRNLPCPEDICHSKAAP